MGKRMWKMQEKLQILKVETTQWLCEETEGACVCTTCLKEYSNILKHISYLFFVQNFKAGKPESQLSAVLYSSSEVLQSNSIMVNGVQFEKATTFECAQDITAVGKIKHTLLQFGQVMVLVTL